jgi:cell division protein ZapA (FtsZ GTPase activity inhibitor)
MSAEGIDLSPRFYFTEAVTGSPATSAEVVVATLNISDDLTALEGVYLSAWASLTVGTDGVSILTRIRRDSLTGTVIKASGATTATAAQLVDRAIEGVDESPSFPNEVYVLTMAVGSASAGSTVSAVTFAALVV